MEDDINNVLMEDENGNKVEFEIITKFDIEDKEYVIVIPKDDKNCEEAIALRIIKQDDGNEVFITVEDDDEFNQVLEVYETLFSK